MKKPIKPFRVSKTAPKGWPTEAQWVEIEKKLAKSLPSKNLPENATPVEKTKYELCAHFVRYFKAAKITQKEMAKQLGVTESRVSEILHYYIERFTIDKLLILLHRIRPEIKIKVA